MIIDFAVKAFYRYLSLGYIDEKEGVGKCRLMD